MVATGLGWYSFNLWNVIPFHPHVTYDTLMAAGLAIHAATGARAAMSRNRINLPVKNALFISIAMIAILGVFYVDRYIGVEVDVKKDAEPDTLGDVVETRPVNMGTIRVGSKPIEFDPKEVETVRPDIFRPGYFSMFDVLVHVSKNGHVDLEYHFNESMNTHVIDKLEGKTSWWYYTYYNGGWRESNYFRSDHYPWKDGTVLHFIEVQPSRLEKTYKIYREEVTRKEANNGRVVIPLVIIDGKTVNNKFEDVEVTAHNLRNDVFQDNMITAIDVILSLDDQEKLSYGLKWYESIGTARIVKNFWVESIDEDKAHGRCGFVYESGDQDLRGFIGNHIHLPSDTRALNSPEYVMYFWICI
jgi:hypothetical protein